MTVAELIELLEGLNAPDAEVWVYTPGEVRDRAHWCVTGVSGLDHQGDALITAEYVGSET